MVFNIVRMADAGAVAILPMLSLVLGFGVCGAGAAGLVSPRLRSR